MSLLPGAAAEGRFDVAGLSEQKVREFFAKLKSAVSARDVSGVAALTEFPLTLGGDVSITNATMFTAKYDAIFTPKVIQALKAQSFETLFSNWRGVMVGDGELWFSGICDDPSCRSYRIRITSISNTQ